MVFVLHVTLGGNEGGLADLGTVLRKHEGLNSYVPAPEGVTVATLNVERSKRRSIIDRVL
jgi:hypothetical protein